MRKRPEVIKNMTEVNELLAKKGEPPVEFNYLLLCNKICGLSHYNMQMNIIVDEPAQFNEWISKQKTVGETISASTENKTDNDKMLAEKK
jgi:cytochrome c oxidase subunit 2